MDEAALKMAQHAGARAGDVICFGHTPRPWHREVDGIHFVNTGRGILAGELPAEFADYLSTGGKRLPAGSG